MKTVWNLDPIYKGFDDPQFDNDLETLGKTIEEFSRLISELSKGEPAEALHRGIELEEKISLLVGKLYEYSSMRQSADTKNTECTSKIGIIMSKYSALAAPAAEFERWAASLPDLMELVAVDTFLADYKFLFENMKADSKYLLEGRGEEIMARMQLSGGSAWSDLQQYLTSTVLATYRGKDIPLSSVRNLAYDPDPSVRFDAYKAELECYDKIKESVAFALNSIKLETLTSCELRGYDSPLGRTLWHSRMQKKTLDAMLSAMDDYLPKFRQYMKAKAKVLGHENGLPWYDLFAPMGSSKTKFTAEETRDYLVGLFEEFNPEEAEMIARAFDEAWIDFYPREGKAGGAYCMGIECLGESRILTNFDGMFGDVVTIAHELGHAYHNHCIKEHRILNHDYSMPLAETASTFNECVVMASAINNAADDDEKLALIESQLQDANQIICDIYSRFKFEAMVFENRSREFMDASALCALMTEAQKQSYGDGLDPEFMHPYMWACKSHYYGPTFYNFPYAFGGLFARGLYAQYEKEGNSFLEKYNKLLYTTAVASAEDTAKVAGIDITDKAFWCDALGVLAEQIDLFCSLVDKNK